VEGATATKLLSRHLNDRISNIFNLLGQFTCRNAEHCYVVLGKPSIAATVSLRSITHVMTYSVYLDRETRVGAIEVENIRADRMLTAKYRSSRQAGA
jgi:hypothetical protein